MKILKRIIRKVCDLSIKFLKLVLVYSLVYLYKNYLEPIIFESMNTLYTKKFKAINLRIYFPFKVEGDLNNLIIGKNVSIAAYVHIWANEKIFIGDNTLIASHVQITTSTHDYNVYPMNTFTRHSSIKIGNNVWIGSGAIIFPGITIGDNSVIGAGTVVNKDVPPDSIAYGVPVKSVKR